MLKKNQKKNTKYKNIERCKIDNKKQIQIEIWSMTNYNQIFKIHFGDKTK